MRLGYIIGAPAILEKIEILKEDGYSYGSINYVRNNGKRMDWIQLYLRNIK